MKKQIKSIFKGITFLSLIVIIQLISCSKDEEKNEETGGGNFNNECYEEQSANDLPTFYWMLEGGQEIYDGDLYYGFGVDWLVNEPNIPTCNGNYKKHNGWDIAIKTNSNTTLSSIVGKEVYNVFDGIIKRVGSSGSGWAKYITIQHTDFSGNNFTTTYHHITPLAFSVGDYIYGGQKIGEVADINLPHLHFSVRRATYIPKPNGDTYNIANSGALPVYNDDTQDCSCSNSSYTHPVFPEYFINPKNINYTDIGYSTETPILLSPTNNSTIDVSGQTPFTWQQAVTNPAYRIQVSKSLVGWTENNGFLINSNLVVNENTGNSNNYSMSNGVVNTTYYWSVRSFSNGVISNYSQPFSFTLANSSSETRIISLTGNLDYGNVTVNNVLEKQLNISNSGNTTLSISEINVPNGYSVVGGQNFTIAPSSSVDITIRFSPQNATDYNGTINVTSNATSGSNTISISGTGTVSDTKIIALSGNLNYGNVSVGTTSDKVLRISNNGNSILNVSSISIPNGYSIIGGQSFSVSAGGYIDRTIRFSPQNAINYNGSISVTSNATSGTNTISISGTGETASTRIIELTGNLNFGNVNVGSSSDLALIIKNIGNSTLHITSINAPNGFQVFGAQNFTLAQGLSTSRTVRFTPQDATSYNDVITVNSNATSGDNTKNVSGTGIGGTQTRVISLSGNTNFGNVAIGSYVNRTLTISNSGNSTLTVTNFNMPTDFTVIGGESFTVSAGSSVNRTIRFTPQSIMDYATTMYVNSDKTSGLDSKTLLGTGVGSADTYTIVPVEDQYTNCPSSNYTCGGNTYQGSTIKMSIVAAEEDYIYFRIKKCDNSSFQQGGTAYLKEDNVCGNTVRTQSYSAGSTYTQLSIVNNFSSGETRYYRGVIIASDGFRAFTYDISITKD